MFGMAAPELKNTITILVKNEAQVSGPTCEVDAGFVSPRDQVRLWLPGLVPQAHL